MIHLHTHSYYSFLDGTIPLRALVERAKAFERPALALTDHNGLYGAIEFYRLAKEAGIRPIIGAQVDLLDGSSLVLLAKNNRGYENLCEIITKARLQGGHLNFQCTVNDILPHRDGMIVLSGGKRGRISRLLLNRNLPEAESDCRWMKDQFGENFFIELQRFLPWDDFLNEQLQRLSRKCGVPLVATNDVHLLTPDDASLRQVLQAIGQNTIRERVANAGHREQYFKSPAEMKKLFAKFPEALTNTERIAEICDLDLALGKPIFPIIAVPEGATSESVLQKLCFEGARERYQPLSQSVIDRVEYELSVINKLGFTDYFLIVKDIVDFCRREQIPCVGRGSAADSIVSYVLGITFADPIRFNLYFERFLNPERTDAPDIDLDICWKNRDRVLEYVYQQYGAEKTAMICTYSTFQSRAAVREVAKTFGLPEDEISQLTRYFPYLSKADNLEQMMGKIPQLKNQPRLNSTYREILAMCKRLAGFPRHLSIHSGGVIIAPDRLTKYTALEVAGKGIVISQYDMHSIERLGLVKMDLLGVRSLTIITECLEQVRLSHVGDSVNSQIESTLAIMPECTYRASVVPTNGFPLEVCGNDKPPSIIEPQNGAFLNSNFSDQASKFYFLKKTEKLSPLDLRAIPDNDPATIRMIKSGKTLGCFQLESPLVRGVIRKMQTDSLDDTVAAVAVIRPGVGDSAIKDEYILRRGGVRPLQYSHPILEPVLKETFGMTVFQEQVMLIAQAVAGFTLAQADVLRRAISKNKDNKQLMNSMKEQFFSGAEKKEIPIKKVEEIWQFLLQFTGFGFNKAHAATYGILAYQTAFLKCYFPMEFMLAVLNNPGAFYSTAVYIEECRRMGMPILPPDVNCSEINFMAEGNSIRVGLAHVFELTDQSKKKIVEEQKNQRFKDVYDFLQRSEVGQKEAEHLIRCGALRSLHPSEPVLLIKTQCYFKKGMNRAKAEFLTRDLNLPPYTRQQQIVAELELLGFAVADHPLSLYKHIIPWDKMVVSTEVEAHKNRRINFTGWFTTSRLQETKSGQYMKFLTLEDPPGQADVIFFPNVYAKYAEILHGLGAFTVTGKVQSRLKGEANIIAEKVVRLPELKSLVVPRLGHS